MPKAVRRALANLGGAVNNNGLLGGSSLGFDTANDPDEKESRVGQHQTGNNSGVLHCGLAYRPGTAKARLAGVLNDDD